MSAKIIPLSRLFVSVRPLPPPPITRMDVITRLLDVLDRLDVEQLQIVEIVTSAIIRGGAR